MRDQIIGVHHWLQTPAGKYLLEWDYVQLDQALADIFGYHALQLGLPELETLRANRMPHQWVAVQQAQAMQVVAPPQRIDLVCDFSALPFSSRSLDVVVLPHTLELSPDPHSTLREVERVLVPEGRVVICALNPASVWGVRQHCSRVYRPWRIHQPLGVDNTKFISHGRLRDWLRLLGLEVEYEHFGCYRPILSNVRWLERFAWMDTLGQRWWPIFGAAYFVVAVKRVHGIRLLGPAWNRVGARGLRSIPLAQRGHDDRPCINDGIAWVKNRRLSIGSSNHL